MKEKKRNEKEKKPLITKFSNITKLGKEKTIVLSLFTLHSQIKADDCSSPRPLQQTTKQNPKKKIKKMKLRKGEGNAEGSTMRKRRVDHDGAAGWKDRRTDGQMGGPRLQMEARVSNEGGDDGRVGLSLSRPVPRTLLLLAGFRCVCGAR